MNRLMRVVGVLSLAAGLFSCVETQTKVAKADRMEIAPEYRLYAPADVAILPVEATETMDSGCRKTMRQCLYDLMMEKGYAPVRQNLSCTAMAEG